MASAKHDGPLQDHEGHAGTVVMSDHDDSDSVGTVVMSDHEGNTGHAGTVVMGGEAPDPQAPIDPRLARMRAIQQAGAGRAVKPRPAPAAPPAPGARSPLKPVFGGAAADDNPAPPPTSDVDPMGGTVAMVDEQHPMGGTVALTGDEPISGDPMGGTVAVVDSSQPVYPVPPPPPSQPPGPALPHGAPPSVVQPPPARRISPIVIGLIVVCGLLAVGAALLHFMRS
jgi:hypothetical protein